MSRSERDVFHPSPGGTPNHHPLIGFRDPYFNIRQYTTNALKYIETNPLGTRGGKTPAQRVAVFTRLLQPDKRVFEIGPGPGLDALELVKAGYKYLGGDIARPFIDHLHEKSLEAIYFDARTDPIPEGVDGIYAHISLIHMIPRDLAGLLYRARETLEDGKAFFASVIEGHGHERSRRTGRFARDFVYYTVPRFDHLLEQEGIFTLYYDRVTASNNTRTLHAGGFFEKEYHLGSYGEKGWHPFGDVYYSTGALYQGNLVHDLVDAQAQAGYLTEDNRDFIKAAERTLRLGIINLDEMAKEINKKWAEGLADQQVDVLMGHAKRFLTESPRFRPLTEAALAVCNNNGFSNTLVGYEPSWLLEVMGRILGIDRVFTAQWQTENNEHFRGTLTGDVYFMQDSASPAKALLRHQEGIRDWLRSRRKRPTVGVGQSTIDASFLAETDYPVFTTTSEENIAFAKEQGYFTGNSQVLYVPDKSWLRWALLEDEVDMVMHLNMITSDRFPIQPADVTYKGLTWICPETTLDPRYFRINQNPAQIL